MQITSTGKLCCLIITLCIIVPMGVGFMLPSSVSQETSYYAGDAANITNDIRNATSDYYGDYYGDYNNSLWGIVAGIPDVKYLITSSNPTSTPIVDIQSSQDDNFDDAAQHTSMNNRGSGYDQYAYRMYYDPDAVDYPGLVFTITTTVDGQITYYYSEETGDAYWLRATGEFVVSGVSYKISDYGENTMFSVSTPYPQYTTYTIYEQTGMYADVTGGINLDNGDVTNWQNGYSNSEIVFNMKLQPNCNFNIAAYNISRSASGIVSVAWGSDVQAIGNYSDIAIMMNEDGVTIMGLAAADLIANPFNRVINTVLMDNWPVQTPFKKIEITSTNTVDNGTDLLQLYVYSAKIKVGSYASTVDKLLDMSGYYANMKGYTLRFTNGSTIGKDASLVVAGHALDLYPKEGIIVYDGISYQLTGLIITIVKDGTRFDAYLNSVNISKDLDQSVWTQIYFQGDWGSIGLSAAPMKATVTDQYNWIAGTFNLSVQEFAGIGLLTAALAFVATAFIGRRSGMKTFWLMVTSGCIAAIYLVLFL